MNLRKLLHQENPTRHVDCIATVPPQHGDANKPVADAEAWSPAKRLQVVPYLVCSATECTEDKEETRKPDRFASSIPLHVCART